MCQTAKLGHITYLNAESVLPSLCGGDRYSTGKHLRCYVLEAPIFIFHLLTNTFPSRDLPFLPSIT